ncbi:MAG: 3-isopropylmalate dehydratase small subunit [Thermodesulfobacteriota bacterium]
MKAFGGKILFLDRDDINTDEIIPARYLTEVDKQAMAPYLFEDLSLAGFNPPTDISGKAAVVTRTNFGCGSSREHAPWALEVNQIHLVIASGFSRIFRQNMFNCGMLAVQLPPETIDRIFATFAGRDATVRADVVNSKLIFEAAGRNETILFSLTPFDRALIEAGGWVEYADARY